MNKLNGIDISSWQSGLNAGTIAGDFAIMKATQGNTYVNPICDTHYQQARAAGKKLGVYHFADHGDAKTEAEFFVNNIRGYIGHALLVLDWEGVFVGDVAWAKTWLDRVHALTGVKPMIYMSESVVHSHDWSSVIAADYGLWVAKYADMNIKNGYGADPGTDFSVDWGKGGAAMWQWTSTGRLPGYGSNLDLDVFYGDAKTWDAYAAIPAAAQPAPVPAPKPTPAPAPAPTPIPVEQAANDHDGSVPVTAPTPVAAPAVDAPAAPVVARPIPAPATQAPTATKDAAVKGYRTAVQTIAGGAVATTSAILAVPQVQQILSSSLNKYVAPALLALGISSGVVAFIMNLIESMRNQKTDR